MSGFVSNMAAKIAAKEWINGIAGWTIWGSSSVYYDRVVYPSLMLYFGNLWGGIVAGSIAILINICFLLFYVIRKSKWVVSADEAIVRIVSFIERVEGFHVVFKLICLPVRFLLQFSHKHVLRRGLIGFIALSCLTDPFVTISYFRQDRCDDLSVKDWTLFFISGIITNTYWTVYTLVFLIPIRLVWSLIKMAIS